MRIAICDDEKRICAILAEKVGKICPDAEICLLHNRITQCCKPKTDNVA